MQTRANAATGTAIPLIIESPFENKILMEGLSSCHQAACEIAKTSRVELIF